jgi:hypothetical protein
MVFDFRPSCPVELKTIPPGSPEIKKIFILCVLGASAVRMKTNPN